MTLKTKLFNLSFGRRLRSRVAPLPGEKSGAVRELQGHGDAVAVRPGCSKIITEVTATQNNTADELSECPDLQQRQRSWSFYPYQCGSSDATQHDATTTDDVADSELRRSLHLHKAALQRLSRPLNVCSIVYEVHVPDHAISLKDKCIYLKVKIEELTAELQAREQRNKKVSDGEQSDAAERIPSPVKDDDEPVRDRVPSFFITLNSHERKSSRDKVIDDKFTTCNKLEKALGAVYDNLKLSIQIYKTQKRRLKIGVSDSFLTGAYIPSSMTSLRDKTRFLDGKILMFKQQIEAVNIERCQLQKERKAFEKRMKK